MQTQSDFVNEPTAIEKLFQQLSASTGKNGPNITMLISPKYHCEIAGEGIEYDWGMIKKNYRNIPLEEKNARDKFRHCVKQAMNTCTKQHVRKIAGKCRRYMLSYLNLD